MLTSGNFLSLKERRLDFAQHGGHQIALRIAVGRVGEGLLAIQARANQVVAEDVGTSSAWAIGWTLSVFNSWSKFM